MECSEWRSLLPVRYLLLGVIGTSFSLFGVLANILLTVLFLTRAHYRHSPFFFLGFVAFFDAFLDATYIVLLSVPVSAQFFENEELFELWLQTMSALHLLWNIFKLASVFCLIMASIERKSLRLPIRLTVLFRYSMTKHWTFTGFSRRTRWIVLALITIAAVLIKNLTLVYCPLFSVRQTETIQDVWVREQPECAGFGRYRMGTLGQYNLGFVNTVAISLPFFTLIFLNGGIVVMLRRQNVQQLRALITELTMGYDVMKIRRRNLRAATRTLLIIITAYLISNLLNLLLALAEFFHADYLRNEHPDLYRLATDAACVLTVIGNAIRCPAHFVSNSEIRQQFWFLFFGETKSKVALPGRRISHEPRCSERLENPWISLLLTVHDKDKPDSPLLQRNYIKRHSVIAIC